MVLEFLSTIYDAFLLGLLTPLTAACVLPLYPGFLAYLSNQLSGKEDKKTLALFGLVITTGVVLFMFILGLVFTTILQVSLTNVVGKVSPIAFGILFVISLLLIFDVDIGKFLPKAKTPTGTKNPWLNAFSFGFFFGAIVVPWISREHSQVFVFRRRNGLSAAGLFFDFNC
jgi:cytochrome c-type biogenesis protein